MFLDYQNNGLNGFWGRLFTRLAGIVSHAIAAISPALADVFIEVYNNNAPDSFFNKSNGYEPTASEETILTNWTTLKFSPFHKALMVQINSIIDNASLNYAQQLEVINSVIQKMCLSKTYLQNNDTNGLSEQAIAWREDFIDEMYAPIFKIIESILANKILELQDYTITNTTINFSPLTAANVLISNAVCSHYIVPVTVNSMEEFTPIKITTQTIAQAVNQNGTSTTTTTTNEIATKNSGLVIAVGLFLVAAVVSIFVPGSKEKKSN